MRFRWLAGLGVMIVAWTVLALAVIRPARAQFGQPTRTPTPVSSRTVTATVTLTATPTPARLRAGATPTATPTLPALVILPAPSVKEGLAGDVFAPPGVALSVNYPTVFGDRLSFGMANLVDTALGSSEGDGIRAVVFSVVDAAFGDVVLSATRTDKDRFCVFGGETPTCAIWDFASSGNKWPSGAAARSGSYILIATAYGEAAGHQGTWTLSFEVRLARDGLQGSDGAARIRSVKASREGAVIEVETFGFTPLALGTHLHVYTNASSEAQAAPYAAGVLEYPQPGESVPARGMGVIHLPPGLIPDAASEVCVALAHPDHTVLPGRGDCQPLPREY